MMKLSETEMYGTNLWLPQLYILHSLPPPVRHVRQHQRLHNPGPSVLFLQQPCLDGWDPQQYQKPSARSALLLPLYHFSPRSLLLQMLINKYYSVNLLVHNNTRMLLSRIPNILPHRYFPNQKAYLLSPSDQTDLLYNRYSALPYHDENSTGCKVS